MDTDEKKCLSDVSASVLSEKYSTKANEKKKYYIVSRIVCLLLAFFIWLYVMSITNDSFEKTFTLIDVKVEGRDSLTEKTNLSIYDISESKISVTVSGPRKDIARLSSSDFSAYIDVSGLNTPGKQTVPVKVSVPSSVSLTSYSPSGIVLYTDGTVTRNVDIVCKPSSFSMPTSFSFGAIEPELAEVSVTGPETVVSRIAAVRAELDLASQWITSSFVHNAVLTPVDDSGNPVESQFLSIGAESINVNIEILTSTVRPIEVSYSPSVDHTKIESVTVSPASVRIEGEASLVSSIGNLIIYSVSGDETGTVTIPTTMLNLPSGITIVNDPGSIIVNVIFKPEPLETVPDVQTDLPGETEPSPDNSDETAELEDGGILP